MPKKHPFFAKQIRQLREAAGLSQYRLAKLAGLTNQSITNLEDGTTANPSWETVQALADALQVPLETFREKKEKI